jgi:HSP20 family protein
VREREDNNMIGHDNDRVKNDSRPQPEEKIPAVAPLLDVYENDTELLLVADVPGVGQDGATVTLEKDRLTVEATGKDRRYHRELVVPPTIDVDKVSASIKAGVLTVNLPKRAQYQPRQIQVRSA